MKRSVSLIVLRYLRLSYALNGIFLWKKMIFHEIFKVGPCPNLKDSSLYERFSIHMYKAEAFGIFNIFCAKFIKMYLFICTRHREFGISTFCAFCDYLTRCKVHDFGTKMIFFMKYFKLVHAPT